MTAPDPHLAPRDASRPEAPPSEAPPPFLGTWPRVYLAVIASQLIFVLLLVAFVEVCA